jgi:fructose-bisphosphate aldolase class II
MRFRVAYRRCVPIATPEQYAEMLSAARAHGYAYPAVNVTSSSTLNAALRGYAEAGSDGIVQMTTGGAKFVSGQAGDPAVGARALAEFAHVVGDAYPVLIALHTDHCTPSEADGFLVPLVEESERRRERGEGPLFNSHMFDGSSLPRAENLRLSKEFLERCAAVDIILEVEIGLVGGEEDGLDHSDAAEEHLYSTPEDALATVEALGTSDGRYILAATFGNVHGVYADVNAKLRPEILGELQRAVTERYGDDAAFNFVFHGGSGSSPAQIAEALSHGVVKMNVDTDMQYAYTRAVADHLFRNYDAVLKVDGRFGDKKAYDPRAWTKAAEASMGARVVQACGDLGSTGKSLFREETAAAPA